MNIHDVRIKRDAECKSDHKILIAKLEFPWLKKHSWKEYEEIEYIRKPSKNILSRLQEFSFETFNKTYEYIKVH